MTDHKYLSDGRKVALVGKLNNEEWIVQEVFVTESGDEIPSGERFTAKSLHDAPVESWKDREMRKKEQRIKELEADYDRIQKNLRLAKVDAQTDADIRKSLHAMAGNINPESLSTLEQFLRGEIRWLVKESDYSFYLPEPFDKAIQDTDSWSCQRRYQGMKLISLFGKANGDLQFGISNYSDGSGGWATIRAFSSFENAARHCIEIAVDRAERRKINWTDVTKLATSDCAKYLNSNEREVLSGVISSWLDELKEQREQSIASATKAHDESVAEVFAALDSVGATA